MGPPPPKDPSIRPDIDNRTLQSAHHGNQFHAFQAQRGPVINLKNTKPSNFPPSNGSEIELN